MRMKGLEDLARFAVVLATPWVAQHKYGETVSYNALVPLDEIKAIGDELERHLEHEAVLFLLVPGPLIAEGLAVIEAWRFNYRDQLVWAGGDGGHSDYVTYTHMLVLIADRGIPSKPSPACRPCSATEFAHYVNTVVEMYPNLPKLALFASIARPGWTSSPVTL